MITEIITFAIPEGMTWDDVIANYRRSAPTWRANPDLIRKNYLFDADPNQVEKMCATLDAHVPLLAPEHDEAILRDAGFSDVALFYAAFTWRGWVAYA